MYSADNYWVRFGDNNASIGATYALVKGMDFAPVYFDLTVEPGAQIAAGAEIGTIEFIPAAYPVIAPAAGKILESNPLVFADPDKMADDPYGDGWLYRITQTQAEIEAMQDALMNANEYSALDAGNCSQN
jgi:glycine cleavage system H protein